MLRTASRWRGRGGLPDERSAAVGAAWRTPAQWLAAAALAQAVGWAAPLAVSRRSAVQDYAFQDTYYVVANAPYVSLSVGMVVVAALYLLLDSLVRAPRRSALRLAHLGLTLGGALLILSAPVIISRLVLPRRGVGDLAPTIAIWNWLGAAGYAMILAGLLVFVLVIADAILRRWRAGRPSMPTQSAPP